MSVPLKLFKLTADCEFYAENISDAFAELANYFKNIMGSEEYERIFVGGEISIHPVKEISSDECICK